MKEDCVVRFFPHIKSFAPPRLFLLAVARCSLACSVVASSSQVRVKSPVSRLDVHALLSDHFEGTWFDPFGDVGAGAEHAPYRWNGLTWMSDDVMCVGTRFIMNFDVPT
jgi:dipeptidase